MKDIRYDAARSREIVGEIIDRQRDGGVNVLFAGGNREAMLEMVNQLADFSGYDVHRINVSSLVADRENQTRGNVREVFDNAKDTASILVLDHSDGMFDEAEMQAKRKGEDRLTGLDYLFQRVDAFKGVCIVQVADAEHIDDALAHDLQFVIRF